jgi:hypothetical protein
MCFPCLPWLQQIFYSGDSPKVVVIPVVCKVMIQKWDFHVWRMGFPQRNGISSENWCPIKLNFQLLIGEYWRS